MMSENNEEIRPTNITFNLKMLLILVVTVAVTILFIRSSQTMINKSVLERTVYNMIGTGWEANNSEHRLVLDGMQINDQEMTLSVAKEQTLNRNFQAMKEFQSRKTELIQNDNFKINPTLHRKKLNRYMTNNKIDKSIPVYKTEDNKTDVTAKNGMYQIDPRSNSINHEYPKINVNIPMSEENDSNIHYNTNDSSYESESYKYKEIIPVDEIKSATSGQSEQINIMKDLSPSGIDSNTHRPHSYHNFKARYPTGQALNYKSLALIPMKNRQPSKYAPDEEYYKLILQQLSHSKISYNNDWVLSLIKLGFIKLKVIGFLQMIFLLGFKLKLFIIAIFIKFVLLMKLMKFFKIVMFPVMILSTLSVFAAMLNHSNSTQASVEYFTQPSQLSMLLPSLFNNMEDLSSSGSSNSMSDSSSSSSGSSSGDSGSSSSTFTVLDALPPNILELLFPSISRESSDRIFPNIPRNSNDILLPDLSPGSTIQNKIMTPYFTSKIQDLNIFNKRHYKSIKSFDPALAIFRNILDSEKCVERIACRMAIAEKADIIPLWIQLWILNNLSKFIPEEIYELYFKTYNFVKNENHTIKSLTPDNLAEWCLEHYG